MFKKPSRVKIGGAWYGVSEGWAGRLELGTGGRHPDFFAEEAFLVKGLYDVFDKNGSKVGEFDMRYPGQYCKGVVNDAE